MMAFNAVLEADLRAISAESRRKYPAVKDAAEHAILKLRSLSDPESIAKSEDVLKMFLLACETKQVKLSVLGLSCLQKLIAHEAVNPSALPQILTTLREHAEVFDETVQLKVLQTVLTVFQSRLFPKDEEDMAVALGVCFRLLGLTRAPDSVHSTASATLRQAVALIFDRVLEGEGLPAISSQWQATRVRSSVGTGDMGRMMITSRAEDCDDIMEGSGSPASKDSVSALSKAGRLGLRLFEDLHALAAGLPASWLQVTSLPRTFALDILEYVVSHYLVIFKKLSPYEQVLRLRVCSLLMTSLRATGEIDGEGGEPTYRRLVLRSVATMTRLYSNIMTTECEVFLSMLIKSMDLDLPLWHRIMVLEVLRGFCVEARVLRLIFQTFDMQPSNTDVVADMVLSLARVVQSVQIPEASEESLAAVAGMFSSKAKGVEWTMEYDLTGNAVVVASEAHAITLAVEGLLGIVFTVAVLTDEAVEEGELDSPQSECLQGRRSAKDAPKQGLTDMCLRMVGSVWRTLLEALSLMLSRSQGEAVVLEILKGYQAFTQACGVLQMVEPRDAFLASLCRFTLVQQFEPDRLSPAATAISVLTAGIRRLDPVAESGGVVLTSKNVQALRTLFNISHRLCTVLGPSWALVLETLAALDRTIHSPHATTQEVAISVARHTRDVGNQTTDFNILSTLDAQLFESSSIMSDGAVKSLLVALRTVSNQALEGVTSGLGLAASGSVATGNSGGVQPSSLKMFAVERMLATLFHNLNRVDRLWGEITVHLLELADHDSPQVRIAALDALDRAIMAVLNCGRIREDASRTPRVVKSIRDAGGSLANIIGNSNRGKGVMQRKEGRKKERKETSTDPSICGREDAETVTGADDLFECVVIMPLTVLYDVGRDTDVRAGALRILLHVLERHGEKLYHSWPDILELLRVVASDGEKDHVPLGFQSVRVVMSDCLSSVPSVSLDMCVEVAGAYAVQKTDVNISLTAVGLLWTTADFFARNSSDAIPRPGTTDRSNEVNRLQVGQGKTEMTSVGPGRPETEVNKGSGKDTKDFKGNSGVKLDTQAGLLLLKVFSVIQQSGTDERPEVRNCAISALFQSIVSHGSKLSDAHWQHCLWTLIFPLIQTVRHLAAHASKEEWVGTELGKQGGKSVHMLVHHSRNTYQKQWEETLVMTLNGVSRLLKSFFPYLQQLEGFKKGWGELLQFVEESVCEGSKEVAVAATTMLYTLLHTHAPKGNMPRYYWDAALATYERLVREGGHAESRTPVKARQEILENLGELYVCAGSSGIFEDADYLKVLALIDVLVRYPVIVGEAPAYAGTLPQVQRTVLEILPKVQPLSPHASLWPSLLRQLLAYLPGGDRLLCDHCRVPSAYLREVKEARKMVSSSGISPAVITGSPTSSNQQLSSPSPSPSPSSETPVVDLRPRLEKSSSTSSFNQTESITSPGTPERERDMWSSSSGLDNNEGMTMGNSTSHFRHNGNGTGGKEEWENNSSHSGKPMEGGSSKIRSLSLGGQVEMFAPTAVWAPTSENVGGSFMRSFPETSPNALSQVFVERVVAMLLEFFSNAPEEAQNNTLPDLVAAFGRCMAVRRDSPDSQLWRTSLAALTAVLDTTMVTDSSVSPPSPSPTYTQSSLSSLSPGRPLGKDEKERDAEGGGGGHSGGRRIRLWRELADLFEKFLVGACGRAVMLPGGQPMPLEIIKGDEALEGLLMNTLCKSVLARSSDAPNEVKLRLVTVVDRCAARTSALPLASASLLPPHCGRFSLLSLLRLFELSSWGDPSDTVETSKVSVGRTALPLLVKRCETILQKYVQDSEKYGIEALPTVRLEEVKVTLKELEKLVLHPKVAESLDIPIHHQTTEGEGGIAKGGVSEREGGGVTERGGGMQRGGGGGGRGGGGGGGSLFGVLLGENAKERFLDKEGRQLGWRRAHLMLLYGTIIELSTTRDQKIAEGVKVLLRLVGRELGII